MICQNCGAGIPDNSNFCTYCGASMNPTDTSAPLATYQVCRYELDLGKLLGDTFEFYKTHFETMCLVGLLMMVIPLIFEIPSEITRLFLQTGAIWVQKEGAPVGIVALIALIGLYLILSFLNTLAQWYMMFGAIRQSLFIVRGGNDLQTNMMFPPPMMFLKVAGLQIIIVCITLGTLLPGILCFLAFVLLAGLNPLGPALRLVALLIPGGLLFFTGLCFSIWIGVRLSLSQVFIADQNMGIIDAMKCSWRATRGNFWMLFLGSIVLGICSSLGLILCCIGVFLTIPISCLGAALAYLQLTGQSHCRDYLPIAELPLPLSVSEGYTENG